MDIAIEATGKTEPVELASKLLRRGRTKLVLVAAHATPATYDLKPRIKGTIVISPHPRYCLDHMDELRRATKGLKRRIFPMDKLITHTFKLGEIEEAFRTARSPGQEYIKGIVIPTET